MRGRLALSAAAVAVVAAMLAIPSEAGPANARLTNDDPALGGYVSDFTLVTGKPYTDEVLNTCSQSRGRQNEPSVAVDPRNTRVIVGSANDYCAVFRSDGTVLGLGIVWLGYYRSENSGSSFVSSLVPGYPGDQSPYAAAAQVRTAFAGDPVLAWDNHGRLFAGSESSGDPEGSAKTLGDVWVATYENPAGESGPPNDDGKKFVRSVDVATGSAAPNLLGKFHDKTAIQVDRTGGPCDGNVYFAWARFTGNTTNGFNSSVYVSRSIDHGQTFSPPVKVTQTVHDIQIGDVAVTGNGHVYVTFRQFADVRSNEATDAVMYAKSTDCGTTFSPAQLVTPFEPYDMTDVPAGASTTSGPPAIACGDFANACESGYTFFRHQSLAHSTADQRDARHEFVYIVYDASKPGTEVESGTTFGTVVSNDLPLSFHRNVGSQAGVFFTRLDGATGAHTTPTLIDNQAAGHQLFPYIAADGGTVHVLWWDSRNDPCYSPKRPVGNCANKSTVPAFDVYASTSATHGDGWAAATRVTDVRSNPDFEQFGGRTVPFAGDYLYISSVGAFSYGVWTDWRNTVPGGDLREGGDGDADSADVLQCRVQNPDGSISRDTCPWAGGLDPQVALVIDVTPATDVPGGNPRLAGRIELGMGAMIARGPTINAHVYELLARAADEEGIAHGFEIYSRTTSTDADEIHLSRAGIPTGLISVPTRYIHTPCEIASLDDIEAVIRLVVAFARRLTREQSFVR